ncbi:MAG: 50S ribosomal protein L10 [Candidatus Hydrogenedentes bacterium]|nr:50S ribosomal protein L10 [Candidatus Hydrogenedentota bacterium]
MATTEKTAEIAELKERIEGSSVVILTKYVGTNSEQVTDLRKRLRDQAVRLKVYKNTLAQLALNELNLGDAGKFIEGPTAWAFSKDPVSAAKILKDYAKDVPQVEMRGGILEGRVVTKQQLEALAGLPAREVLIAQVVGTMAAPLRNFVGVLAAVPRNLVNVLEQIRKQKESAAAA